MIKGSDVKICFLGQRINAQAVYANEGELIDDDNDPKQLIGAVN